MCLLIAPALRAQTSQPADPAFEREIEQIDARAQQVTDLTAHFEQQKHSPLLREPLVSRGTVAAQASRMLWDTVEPEATRMLTDGTHLRIYYPRRGIIEEYPVHGRLGRLVASPLPRLAALREQFRLLPDERRDLQVPAGVAARALRLEPVVEDVAQYVDHVRVLLDTERGLILAFEVTDPEGERTLIQFSRIEANVGLSDRAFDLKAPADVKVVRPLEGSAGGGK